MAQLVDYYGSVKTIDLWWDIGEYGCPGITLIHGLGMRHFFDIESNPYYEAKRLIDGSIEVVHEKETGGKKVFHWLAISTSAMAH